MQKTLENKFWSNKANSLTAYTPTQEQALAILLKESNIKGLKCPSFEDVYEIPKI